MWRNDVALVKLDHDVPSGPEFNKIMEIKLPGPNDHSFPSIGQHCAFTGWGCTHAGQYISSHRMGMSPCRSVYFIPLDGNVPM